jgi:hypothetical protein
MIGIAIGIALLPNLSRKIKANEIEKAIKLQNLALEFGLILVIPATLALTCLANPIISSLFERGAFSPQQTNFVANALMFYSFGLPAYVLVKIMEPAFFSRGDTKSPMNIAIICLFSNALLNIIFYLNNFSYVGIILSSIISSYLNLSMLFTRLIRKKHFYFEKDFTKKLILILIPSLLMAFTLIILRIYFENSDVLNKVIELIIMILLGLLVYAVSSYITVNISSPNTKNLRALQGEDMLRSLLSRIQLARTALCDEHGVRKPLFLKIAPDLDPKDIRLIADLLIEFEIDAVIATNTTIERGAVAHLEHGTEAGGLSGAPVRALSNAVIQSLKEHLGDRIPIIGVGGILSGSDAQEKRAAGASLLQIYSGLIFKGPELVRECALAVKWGSKGPPFNQ